MTTATGTADIFIRPDALHPGILRFIQTSALADLTTVEQHPNGWARVAPNFPVAAWSDGEQTLWGILGSLVEGDLHRAFDRLDGRNLTALCALFADWRGAVLA